MSSLIDQLILRQLLEKYTVTFPLKLTGRSTTLALLAKMPGFLQCLNQLAQFMTRISACYNIQSNHIYHMYKGLQLLMVDCDSDMQEKIREYLTYINGFSLSLGDEWKFNIQIKLYQFLVKVLTGEYSNKKALTDALKTYSNNVEKEHNFTIEVNTLMHLFNSVNKGNLTLSPYRLLALGKAIAHVAPTPRTQFTHDDVTNILTEYNNLLYTGCFSEQVSPLEDGGFFIRMNFKGLNLSHVSGFFVELQRLYSSFHLADINVHFGFDLLVLFASQEQDYCRVGQWNKQLFFQKFLCCFSDMKKSVLSSYFASYIGNVSGVFSEDFFKQLLISGIQTGVYFEHAFFVDSDNTFRKYFELTRPPVDFLRQSQAHYSMAAALEEIAEHILFLSGVQPISDSSNRWNKFISRFSKIVRDLNDLFPQKRKSCWRVIVSAICCCSSQRRPTPERWPNDVDYQMISVNNKPLMVSNYPWVDGWASPFHALYGVPSITGEAPRVTNAIFELDTCIESALRLIMAFDNDNKEMSSKNQFITPILNV